MASLAAEITWVIYILRDLGVSLPRPPLLFIDNFSALHLTTNPMLHARTKYIELDYHFVREKVVQGAMVTRFILSLQRIADMLPKPLSKSHFQFLRSKRQNPNISLRGMIDNQILTRIRITLLVSRV